ncbi:MAG: endolytic transglycosylase MltG [Clostridiales bacterium]|nr:endolytic transglycosylase MltG [Clostridiales bacterium]
MYLYRKQFERPEDGSGDAADLIDAEIKAAAEEATEEVEKAVEETTEEISEAAEETTEEVSEAAEETIEEVSEAAEETAEEVKEAAEEAEVIDPEEAKDAKEAESVSAEDDGITDVYDLQSTAKFKVVGEKPPEIKQEEEGEQFIEEGDTVKKGKKKKQKSKKWETVKLVWSKVSPVLALICAVFLTYLIIKTGVNFAVKRYLMPVDPNDPTPIVVEIPKSSGASAIAKILYEAGGEGQKGLIQNKAVFKVYVDFQGKSSGLKAGTYILSRNMSISQIVDIICTGNPPRATAKFTVSEGMTVEAVAKRLVEKGILKSPDRFLELCTDAKEFANKYWFVKSIVEEGREGRTYMLEGYLFPDTYEVFQDATEEEIITKMLNRFNEIYTRRYVERAEELDLTMDDVVILASIIEKEAKPFDFTKVSAVFHSRLNQSLPLHSDATLNYILKSDKMIFDQDELNTDSPYNTYKNYGLPAGPISNPGVAAIEAALFPNEQYMREGYLFFCLMDPNTGALIFAKTEAEHAANVEKYKPNW